MRPSVVENKDDGPAETVRLQVLLAKAGLGSRRACEEFITEGRVTIDGETVTELGTRVRKGQKVLVDGEGIRAERTVYYLVNKPRGVLCTNEDPRGRPRVIDLFPKHAGRLYPVGRLDEETVGLLLVTNDGEISHQLAHPKFRVPKKYKVHVAGTPSWEQLEELRRGMYFSDGKFKVEGIKELKKKGQSAILEVILSEGQNREIRRLFARIGHKVLQLERVGIGPLKLGELPVGAYRPLTPLEVKKLHEYLSKPPDARGDVLPPPPKPRVPRKRAAVRPASKGPSLIEVSSVTRRGHRDFTGQRIDTPRRPAHPGIEVSRSSDRAPIEAFDRAPAAERRPTTERRPSGAGKAGGDKRSGGSRSEAGRRGAARVTGDARGRQGPPKTDRRKR